MTTSHTAGPWHFDPQGGLPVIQIYCPDGKNPFHGHRSEEECAANARLMAASPELLECLQETFGAIGTTLLDDVFGHDWLDKAKAAIAKATGA